MLMVWVSPVLLFLGLVAAPRVSALVAALCALALAAIVVLTVGPQPVGIGGLVQIGLAGAWIALPAVAVILAGLYFTATLAAAVPPAPEGIGGEGVSPRELGTICLLVGPFVETATGFGVGYVVAVSAVLRAGLGPAAALGLGAFSQCLVPWGGLGIGTKISAAIVGASLDELTWRIAIVVAPVLWAMVMVYWAIIRANGVAIDRAQHREDALTVGLLSVLLIGTSLMLPIELAALTALAPLLIWRTWRSRGREIIAPSMLRAVLPYAILMAILAVTKLVPEIRDRLSAHAFSPGEGAPDFALLASPALALVLAAWLSGMVHGHWRGLVDSVGIAGAKGLRASVLTILLVMLAWIIVRAGIAEAFAQALRGWVGDRAPLVVPVLGGLGGYLTGSNTGAGSLSMPVATSVAETREALYWVAAAAIMAGSVFTAFSPVRFAMGRAIAEAGPDDARRAARGLVPFAVATLGIAVGSVFAVGLFGG